MIYWYFFTQSGAPPMDTMIHIIVVASIPLLYVIDPTLGFFRQDSDFKQLFLLNFTSKPNTQHRLWPAQDMSFDGPFLEYPHATCYFGPSH